MNAPSDIPTDRRAEHAALLALLTEHAAENDDLAADFGDRIAQASMMPGHLWRAMELGDRSELQVLFETHFPTLAAGNTRGMRWKKYLYKLMCGWPGFEG